MTVLLAFTAATAAETDMPEWAPLVFGIGSLLVLVLVIVLARRKMNESARWRRAQGDVAPDDSQRRLREDPPHDPPTDPRQDPRRNDGA